MLLKSSNYFHYCFSKKILQKRNLNGGSKLQVRIQKKLFPKAVDSIKFLMVYSRPLFPNYFNLFKHQQNCYNGPNIALLEPGSKRELPLEWAKICWALSCSA